MKGIIKRSLSFILALLIVVNTINFPMVSHANESIEMCSLTVGTIASATGKDSASEKRARTEMYDISMYLVEVSPENAVKYAVFCYDENSMYLGWTNWLTNGNYTIKDGTRYIRILMAYVNSRAIGEVELAELEGMLCITKTNIEVTAITLNETALNLLVGNSAELFAEIEPEDATNQEITWTSSDNSVATITGGIVYAIAPGTALITATANNGIAASCEVRVDEAFVSDILSIGTISSSTGENSASEKRVRTEMYDINAYLVEVSPENAIKYAVFCYDENGLYLGWTNWLKTENYTVKEDTRYIRIVMAYADGRAIGNAALIELDGMICVTNATAEVTAITLNETELNLFVGDSAELFAEVEPNNATDIEIAWTSSDEGVATVTNGTISAVAAGTAVITAAADNGIAATCVVSVSEHQQSAGILTLGKIDSSIGLERNATNRCRTGAYDLSEYEVSVTPASDVKYGVFCYGEDGAYLGWTNWIKTSSYQTKTGTKTIRLVFTYDDNRQLNDNDLLELATMLHISKLQTSTYTVTYDAGQGTFPSNKSHIQTVSAEPGYYFLNSLQEIPVLEGYEFKGWLYEGKFVEQVNLTSNITLTAKWCQVFDLTYDANGGGWGYLETNGQFEETTKVVKVGPGTHDVTNVMDEFILDPERPGYAFVGWKLNGKIVRRITVNGPVTLVAEWEPAYVVTYDANGGYFWKDNDGNPITTETTEPQPEGLYFIGWAQPVREDSTYEYEFDCWTVNVNGVDKVLDRVDLTGPITVKAQWRKKLTIKYNANGGTFGDNKTTHVEKCFVGTYSPYWVGHEWPEKEGYSFLGWSTKSSATTGKMDYETVLTKNTTFYAVWTERPTITYDANGGFFYHEPSPNGGEVPVTVQNREVNLGENKVEGFGVNYDGPYQFLGWATTADATTVEYAPDAPITITGSITLYAVWKQLPTIIYDANVGTNGYGGWGHYEPANVPTMEGEEVQDIFVVDQTEKLHWDNVGFYYYVGCDNPERPGYEFMGWYDAEDRKADDREIQLEDGKTYRFYAHWAKRIQVTYVTNLENTGWGWWYRDYTEDGNEVIKFQQTSFVRDALSGEGYDIDGWTPHQPDGPAKFLGYTTDPKGTQVQYLPEQSVTFTDDVTLYAIWGQHPTVHYVCREEGSGWTEYRYDSETEEDVPVFMNERIDWRDLGDHEYYVYYVGCWEPERKGYKFAGWADANGRAVEDDARIDLREGDNIYLYATWEKVYTVTYVTELEHSGWGWETYENEDGTTYEDYECTSFTDEELTAGEYRIHGWRPDCQGAYKFLGYTLTSGGTVVQYAVDDSFDLTEDVTFYAVWEKLATITYHGNGGGWGEISHWDEDAEEYVFDGYEDEEQEDWVEAGRVYYVGCEEPWRNDEYEFDCWMDGSDVPADGRELTIEEGGEYHFYARWRKRVTVTYETSIGGWGWFDDQNPEGERYEWTSFTTEDIGWGEAWTGEYNIDGWRPNCNDGPYEFIGYVTDPENGKVIYQPGQTINLTDDVTLYAVWKQLPTIHYDANGGGWGDRYAIETTFDVTYHYEQEERLDWRQPDHYYHVRFEEPHREGYDFAGWVDASGKPVDEADAIYLRDGDEYTFTAAWNPRVTVTYRANGGVFDGWDEERGESASVHYRSESAGEYWLDGWHPNREGFEFGGWGFSEIDVTPVAEPFILQGDTTFYAIWIPLATVTYDANGGQWQIWGPLPEGGDGPSSVTTMTDEGFHRGRYHVSHYEPYREGYEFIGWARTSDALEANYEWDTEISGDTTFYAVWSKLAKITLDAGDGYFWKDENGQTVTIETDYTRYGQVVWSDSYEKMHPQRDGYRFEGWLLDGNAYRRFRVTGDVTLTADWVKVYDLKLNANGGYFDYESKFDVWERGYYQTLADNQTLAFYVMICEDGQGYDFFNGHAPLPHRDGYVFTGWQLGGQPGAEYAETVVINGADVELFATWEAETIAGNGGDIVQETENSGDVNGASGNGGSGEAGGQAAGDAGQAQQIVNGDAGQSQSATVNTGAEIAQYQVDEILEAIKVIKEQVGKDIIVSDDLNTAATQIANSYDFGDQDYKIDILDVLEQDDISYEEYKVIRVFERDRKDAAGSLLSCEDYTTNEFWWTVANTFYAGFGRGEARDGADCYCWVFIFIIPTE